ncbi:MAG TPA: serine/threonine-protein kinase [Gemmatimonadales bacterium]
MSPPKLCTTCKAAIPAGALYCLSCGSSSPTEIAEAGSLGPTPVPASPASATRREVVRHSLSEEAIQSRLTAVQGALGAGYEIQGLIGRGGFGEVWAAIDSQLGREIAIKVLRAELSSDLEFRARFRREARAIARLRHPGIVPIYHVGEAAGLVYFVMPLVQGVTLKAALADPAGLSADEAVRILIEAAGALREAHHHGVVHRDLKPENIMLEGPRRRALLMDFGVAKIEDSQAGKGEEGLTETDTVLGSPEYMSPEQATGRALDARSDIYSLGVVAYRMLAGRLPFDAETPREVLAHHVLSTPQPIGDHVRLSDSIAAAVMRCLAKLPEERWQSAEEFARALVGGAPRLSEIGAPPPAVAAAATSPRTSGAGRTSGSSRAAPKRRSSMMAALLFLLLIAAATPWPIARWWNARKVAAVVPASVPAPSAPASAAAGRIHLSATVTPGCIFAEHADTLRLSDRAPRDNCWFPAESPKTVAPAFEYSVRFRASNLAQHAGIGLAWCQGEGRDCRVAFIWPGAPAEWGKPDARSGLSLIQMGKSGVLAAGQHELRVRYADGTLRCSLDGSVVLERRLGADSAYLVDPDVVTLVVQNMAVTLAGPDAVRVLPAR